jgi:PAS domain S-box-containing protein
MDEVHIHEGYWSGAVDYIFKPVQPHILRCKVNVFLNIYNQKQTILKEAALLKKSAAELTRVNAVLKESEEKYRSYVENAPDGVFIADRKGRYIEVNEAACRITGYSKNGLLTMNISDLLPNGAVDQGMIHFKTLLNTGTSKADLLFRHKDGSSRWWALEAVKLSPDRFLGFTKDITHRKEMEEEIKEQQEKLEVKNTELIRALAKSETASEKYTRLHDFAPSGFFTLSKDYKILELNHRGAMMLGRNRSSLINSPLVLFISIDTLPVFKAFFTRIFATMTKEVCEVKLETEGNPPKYVHVEGVSAENGLECLLNVIDITERKLSQEALENSKIKLEDAQRIAHIGNWDYNLDQDMMVWSKEMYHVFDISPGSFDGKPETIMAQVHPDDVDAFLQSMSMHLKGAQPPMVEYRVIHQDGSVHHMAAESKTEYDLGGNPLRVFGTVQDITERKLAEQAMKISEEKYKTMLNASPDGILLIDMKGIITEVSEIGLELLGADSRDDIVGKYIYRFIPSDEKNTIRELVEKTLNEGLAQNIGIKVRKKNRTTFAGEASSTLIQGPDGSPLSFMIIIRDISQRKKMETKQMHADRMASLGEMASGIAHEINQPLNIISMVMDKILFESAKTESIDLDFLKLKSDKIFDNITRMRNIIDHIRTFSRSQDEYVLTAFDINESIENAVSMIMQQFRHLGIDINLVLDKKLPQIFGNTYKFEQVILNLMMNAKDAVIEMKNKKEQKSGMMIGIRTYQESSQLVTEVTDNGTGISHEDINNILLPFYTTKDEGKGTGLGLSICYQIMKEMNGSIDIISDGDCGTTVKLVLEIQNRKQ